MIHVGFYIISLFLKFIYNSKISESLTSLIYKGINLAINNTRLLPIYLQEDPI